MKYHESLFSKLHVFAVKEGEVWFNPMCMQKYELLTAQNCLHIYTSGAKFCVPVLFCNFIDG